MNPNSSGQPPLASLSAKTGVPFELALAARDAFGNVATSYAGAVSFTSSDAAAQLPERYQFLARDQGAHVFRFTLNTKGAQRITVADTTGALNGEFVVMVD